MYKFRKIIMLALCLALVCAMNVSAFAASFTLTDDFADGNTWIEFYGNISQNNVTGLAEVTSAYGEGYAEVEIDYQYYNTKNELKSGYGREVELSMAYVLEAPTDNGAACKMYDADCYFWVDIPTDGQWEDFDANAHLEY